MNSRRSEARGHNPEVVSDLQSLHPAYFAMVMATGIVSTAAYLTGYELIARSLVVLNIVAYLVLVVLYVLRAFRFPRAVLADLAHHGRGVGFFTVIAGTSVLGSQFVTIVGRPDIGLVLWIVGIILWGVLTYGILTLLTVKPQKPDLRTGLNGGWLVLVVAAQSISILGSQLSHEFRSVAEPMVFFSLVMWLGAGMLYIWLISLIFYRYTFLEMAPEDLAPPYWINMGAVAISTLAGTFLLDAAPRNPLVAELTPFIKGITLLFWATATWWIPMLLTLGFWRHVYRRFPLRYDPLYWGAVFPLGMYTVCTYRLANAVDAPFLDRLPRFFVFIAFAAWMVTFIGLGRSLLRRLRRKGALSG